MNRRAAIAVALLLIAAAVWLLRGGEEPRTERSAGKRDAMPVEPGTDRPKDRPKDRPGPRDADVAVESGEPGSFRRRQQLAPSKLSQAPLPGREGPPMAGQSGGQAPAGVSDYEDEDLNEMIRVATQDPDPGQRAAAVADLALQDDLEPVLPVFKLAATDPDEDVRLAVVSALDHLGAAVPMELLRQLANDPDPLVRVEVLDFVDSLSLEDGLPDSMRPILEQATNDPDDDVRDAAQDILERLSDEEGDADESEG
jgi:HEAT repeat protein